MESETNQLEIPHKFTFVSRPLPFGEVATYTEEGHLANTTANWYAKSLFPDTVFVRLDEETANGGGIVDRVMPIKRRHPTKALL